MNVDDVVAARIEQARQRAERQKADRARRAKARDAGLAQRHATKLRHQDATNPEETTLSVRIDHCPGCKTERVHRRVAGALVSNRPHDVWRCTHGPCALLWALPADPHRTAAPVAVSA